MFKAFNERELWQAIEKKDYVWLKLSVVRTMRTDHTFKSDELEKLISILKKNVPEIFEKEVELEYEERFNQEKWDESYFIKLTYWFEKNFSESRIPYIKEVGRAVFEPNNVEEKKFSDNKMKEKKNKKSNFSSTRMIAAIVLVVLMLLLFKKLMR